MVNSANLINKATTYFASKTTLKKKKKQWVYLGIVENYNLGEASSTKP